MKIGIVMDPIDSINFKKDSSLSILLEAQSRGHELFYMEPTSLLIQDTGVYGLTQTMEVKDNPDDWFETSNSTKTDLSSLDLIFMRQDPPFNSNYIYNTYVLEQAEEKGVKVINKPSSLRDCNEKIFATLFTECCTPFLVASDKSSLREFIEEHKDTVVKPLDGMGGNSIFRVRNKDPNISVILENITLNFQTKIMMQRYIPEIKEGDKRIIMINGEPMQAAIARIPAMGELRGNLAAGATARSTTLTLRDKWICDKVGPKLKELGLVIVGLDIIGDYLTEINVTSPTCFKEYNNLCNIDVASFLFNYIEESLD